MDEPVLSLAETVKLDIQRHELLRWMGLGYTYPEACERHGITRAKGERWLAEDEVFAALVEQARRQQELEFATELEAFKKIKANIFKQAMTDSVAGARLGMEWLARCFPEQYGTASQKAAAKSGNPS